MKFTFFTLFILLFNSSFAQNGKSLSELSGFQLWDLQFMADNPDYYSNTKVDKINKTLKVTAHILIIDGDTTHTQQSIIDQYEKVNKDFEATGLSFSVCEFKYFHGHQYKEISIYPPTENASDLPRKFYKMNTINMYFVKDITTGPGSAAGGFAPLPMANIDEMNYDYIVIAQLSSIAHELGHFFGLYHTHETDFGDGYADNRECNKRGDLLCDTPSEPDLSDLVNSENHYNANEPEDIKHLDPDGERYYPSTMNIMSYAPNGKYFSPMQIKKMVLVYNTFKTHLQ